MVSSSEKQPEYYRQKDRVGALNAHAEQNCGTGGTFYGAQRKKILASRR